MEKTKGESDIKNKHLTCKNKSLLKDHWFAIIMVILLIIKYFFFDLSIVSGHSMDSTLDDRQFIIIDRISYSDIPFIGNIKNYERGDIIVFDSQIEKHVSQLTWKDNFGIKNLYVKRIIGTEGDYIKIIDGEVFIKYNNTKEYIQLNEPYLNEENKGYTYVGFDTVNEYQYIVPKNEFFVLGDNRNASSDSRTCFQGGCKTTGHTSFVEYNDIVGAVIIK